jgi:hypothetical protein
MIDLNVLKKPLVEIESTNDTQIFFDDIEDKLLSLLDKATYVIGCVSWLTNPKIISKLLQKPGVKIIINKEEYLKPTSHIQLRSKFFSKLRFDYNDMDDLFQINCPQCNIPWIKCSHCKDLLPTLHCKLTVPKDNESIICCGIVNSCYRMHHKFLIMLDDEFKPQGVWTGSYNLSQNSNSCLENALFLSNPLVCAQYLNEFERIYHLTEPFTWVCGTLDIKNKKSYHRKV